MLVNEFHLTVITITSLLGVLVSQYALWYRIGKLEAKLENGLVSRVKKIEGNVREIMEENL